MKTRVRVRASVAAIFLAIVIMFSMTAPVFATGVDGGEPGIADSVPGAESIPEPEPEEVPEAESGAHEDDSAGDPAENPADAPSDSEDAEPEAGGNDESQPAETPPESPALPESSGMTLSGGMIAEKRRLSGFDVATMLSDMAVDEDYVNHEVVYLTSSESEARQVANAYNGILTSFSQGVAVIKIVADTVEAIEVAEDMESDFPAVYPNFLYTLEGTSYSAEEIAEATPEEEPAPADTSEPEEPADKGDNDIEVVVQDNPEPPPEEITAEDIKTVLEQREVTAADIAAYDALQQEAVLIEEDTATPSAVPISDDTFADEQWHHEAINTLDAWNAGAKGKGVTVAVIDSGINGNHEDLKKNIAGKFNTAGHAINGTEDNNGHGTHVAGIIAAQANNGKGVAGVAPEAKIISIKALDLMWNPYTGRLSASGSTADIVRAVNMAVSKKVHVINMSLGGDYGPGGEDPVYKAAVTNALDKGIVVVVAAGNETTDLASEDNTVLPAEFPGVITVSATVEAGGKASYSNYGAGKITIAAPGSDIASTYKANSYAELDGTSMATPVVSGVVALAISANPAFKNNRTMDTVDGIEALLEKTAKKTAPYTVDNSSYYGAGLVNAGGTLGALNVAVTAPTLSQLNKAALESTNAAGTVDVTITDYDPSLTYYYTLNGKAPTIASDKSTGTITIDTNGKKKITLKVLASNSGKLSPITTADYTLKTGVASFELVSSSGVNSVALGKTLTLKPTFVPAKPTNTGLIWSSADPTIATVSNKGVVTGKMAGENVWITATSLYNDEIIYDFRVYVMPLTTALALTTPAVTLATTACIWNGESLSTSQTLAVNVTPEDALAGSDNFTYKSSSAKVATVSPTGEITAVGKGKATITVTAKDGSKKSVKCTVTVVKPALISEVTCKQGQVTGAAYTVAQGKTIDLTAVLADKTASNTKLQWTSGDDTKVKVNNGKISGVGVTTAPVPVTVQTADGVNPGVTINISVKPATTGLTLASSTGSTELQIVGTTYGSATVNVTTNPADAHNKFVFTSSNKKVVTVNPDTGVVTAVGKGSANITAKATDGSGKSKSLKFTVVKPITAVYVNLPTTGIAAGKKVKFTASVYPTDASSKKVNWGIEGGTGYFSIDQNGNLKALKKYTGAVQSVKVYVTVPGSSTKVYAGGGTGANIRLYNYAPTSLKFYTPTGYNSLGILEYKTVSSFTADEGINHIGYVIPMVSYYKGQTDFLSSIDISVKDDRIADFYQDANGKWVIAGYSPGTTTITASTMDGSNKKATLKVKVIASGGDLKVIVYEP